MAAPCDGLGESSPIKRSLPHRTLFRTNIEAGCDCLSASQMPSSCPPYLRAAAWLSNNSWAAGRNFAVLPSDRELYLSSQPIESLVKINENIAPTLSPFRASLAWRWDYSSPDDLGFFRHDGLCVTPSMRHLKLVAGSDILKPSQTHPSQGI